MDGDGVAGPSRRRSIFRTAQTPSALAAGDFDGDGRQDLAVTTNNAAGGGADTIAVFLSARALECR